MEQFGYLSLGMLVSYLVGAIPFGLFLAKIKGIDILNQGSGNIGATNVGRVLGAKYGLAVFVLDALKGALPAKAGMFYLDTPLGPEIAGILMGASAIFGHLFPIYLKFKGGKGIATSAGAMAMLVPIPLALALLTWAAFTSSWGFVSLGSLASTIALCSSQAFIALKSGTQGSMYLLAFTFLATVLVWIKHIPNIYRLLAGAENRVKDSTLWRSVASILLQLSLGIWLGTVVFFTGVIGPGVFTWFEKLCVTENPPYWLPTPEAFKANTPVGFPNPLLKEQASRLAGVVVSPAFPVYFAIQVICGFTALIILWGNQRRNPAGTLGKTMLACIGVGLLLAIAGWAWEPKVEKDRIERARLTDQALLQKAYNQDLVQSALKARKDFTNSHLVSLGLNITSALGMLAGIILFAIINANRNIQPAQAPLEN